MLKGKKHSEKTRKKMREASARFYANGGVSNRKGVKATKETRKKLSISHKGYKVSEITKRKISEANKGFVHAEKSKLKMSLARRGKKLT